MRDRDSIAQPNQAMTSSAKAHAGKVGSTTPRLVAGEVLVAAWPATLAAPAKPASTSRPWSNQGRIGKTSTTDNATHQR